MYWGLGIGEQALSWPSRLKISRCKNTLRNIIVVFDDVHIYRRGRPRRVGANFCYCNGKPPLYLLDPRHFNGFYRRRVVLFIVQFNLRGYFAVFCHPLDHL